MNKSELENKLQLKSDEYVLDLEKRYGPSEIKDTVITFLKSKPHKVLLLESSDTSATAWKLLQVLKELQSLSDNMVSNDYSGSQNRTMLKWGQISEILQSSEAFPKLKNLIACEFDESVELCDKKLINTIIERISFTINTKIIFIISSKDKISFKEVKSDSIIYFKESENKVMPFYGFETESLIERASVGDVSAVKDILENKVDVNGTLPDGTTALHKAATNGWRDVALALLSNGANHLPNENKDTPLHAAAENGHEDIVKLFLENKVDVDIKGSFERTALHCAAAVGHTNIVLTLLRHGAKLLPDSDMDTPLHDAARGGHADIVKLFLENEVDVDIKASDETTALHYAAAEGHTNIVLTLLRHGAKLLPDSHMDTPLHDAARGGHADIVKLFLENEVDVDIKGSNENTALHYAAENGHTNIVLTLLRHGAKHLPDSDMDTPLHDAARGGHSDIVKLFLENEVDVDIKGSDEETALHYAAAGGHTNIVLTLLRHGAKLLPDCYMDTPLHDAARLDHADIVKLFLENCVDVNTKGLDGMTALHHAVRRGHKDVIVTLVKKGAKIDIKNNCGQTALYLAQNQKDLIKLLIQEREN